MNKHLSLSKNKTLEVQVELWEEDTCWFDFELSCTRKTDHAGFYLDIVIWRFCFYFSICDNRHWNYDENRWETERDAKARSTDCGILTEDD